MNSNSLWSLNFDMWLGYGDLGTYTGEAQEFGTYFKTGKIKQKWKQGLVVKKLTRR